MVSEDKETKPPLPPTLNLSAKPQGGKAFKQASMLLKRDLSLGGFNRVSISATRDYKHLWATNGSFRILRY